MSLAGWEADCPGKECPHLFGDKRRGGSRGGGQGERGDGVHAGWELGGQHLWIPIGGQLSGLLRVGDIADWFITS